ncbi:FtsK/SpoIIIE domain-containing protein [Humibacter sp.]|uniref:FtsK/SpoIIIE domain-containing protein n=1 Tax=Humibacter sp. TaxID=1940291 RepID=UPI003F814A66
MPATDPTIGEPLTLPSHPAAPPKTPFPLLAVLAPLVGAAVLFAIVRSPYMLAFAALSPVIAVASTIDGRLSARRRRRAAARAYAADVERFAAEVEAAHDRVRAVLQSRHPAAAALLRDATHRPRRWTEPSERFAQVRVGSGALPSAVPVSGAASSREDRELLAGSRIIDGAPIVADPAAGIGLIGVRTVARAALRGLVVQLAHAHPPGMLALAAPPGEAYDWLDDYPHGAHPHDEPLRLRIVDDAAEEDERVISGARAPGRTAGDIPVVPARGVASTGVTTAVFAVADRVDELPAGCRVVAAVEADGTITVLSPPEAVGGLRGELVTAQEAAAFGRELALTARTRGVGVGTPLPGAVRFADLVPAEHSGDGPAGLPAVVGVAPPGPLVLDLVASGPHAIVTGTTGSGKSELLITWVLGMAALAPPERVGFLLVDFKGGTAFQRLTALPHTVGVVTDLAHGEASRALKSLRAELRRRESELAGLGVSDIADAADGLSRLIIVVDEAAAMFAAFPELGELFSDLAARGRALGVHLILGTQRATGVLSDALIANCALRVSLRLASDADSTALLGTDAAARLPHNQPGRLVVSRDGELLTAQAATTEPGDVDAVAQAYSGASRPSAPWLPALPPRIPLSAFGQAPPGSVVIGARDDPDHQLQEGILYRPENAHLLVLGVRGCGKSTVLRVIRAQWAGEVIVVPYDIEGAWDALERAESLLHGETRDESLPADVSLVLMDDVDALLERFDDEHRDAATERIRSLLTDGPRAGIGVVCTAAVLPSGLRNVHGRFGERLLLRHADRQEHVLAGAPADLFDPSAPPGRGVWRDKAVQVALVNEPDLGEQAARSAQAAPPVLEFPTRSITLVVARSPGTVASRLRHAVPGLDVIDLTDPAGASRAADASLIGHDATSTATGGLTVAERARSTAIIGDPDAWQSAWSLLGRLRPSATVVFDGCTLAQVRAVLHARILPPATLPGHLLVCDQALDFSRARMPS